MLLFDNLVSALSFWDRIPPVDASKNQPQHMHIAIGEIAKNCSSFVHHIVRISDTAEGSLRLDSDSFVEEMLSGMNGGEKDAYLKGVKIRIEAMRDDMITFFHEQKHLGVPRHAALMPAYSKYAFQSMKSGMGNCAEKALLAGIFIKATMTTALRQRGFSEVAIARANIQISIADNGDIDGDHTICVLRYDIDGERTLIVDPWMKGTVYNQEDAQDLYDEKFIFANLDENKSLAVNDDECVNAVIECATILFDQDPHFLRLFHIEGG